MDDVEYYPVFTTRGDAEAFVLAAGYPSAYEVAIASQGEELEELRTESPELQQMPGANFREHVLSAIW